MNKTMEFFTPNIMVDDMMETIRFYKDILGFDTIAAVPSEESPEWIMLQNNNATIMFQKRESIADEYSILRDKPVGASLIFFIMIKNIDDFFEQVKNQVKIISTPHNTFYEKREFSIEDCNGYILTFAEEIKD